MNTDNLSKVLGISQQIVDAENLPVVVEQKKYDPQVVADADFARDRMLNIIEKGGDALDLSLKILRETNHPRCAEVVGQLLKVQSDNIEKILKLQKDKKDLLKDESGNGGDTSINIEQGVFVGSTADLLKKIKSDTSPQ